MPQKLKILLISACLTAGLACSHSPEAGQWPPEHIERLDLVLADTAKLDSVMQVGFADLMGLYGHTSVSDSLRSAYAHSAAAEVFGRDIAALLPPLDSVESVLGHVRLAADSTLLPRLRWATTFGAVIPFNQSIITDEQGNLLIGLNHYLGSDYAGYRGKFPVYTLGRKQLSRLPVDVASALVRTAYPRLEPQGESPTLLSGMLYEGAVASAMSRLLPEETPEGTLTGHTPEQVEWMESHAALIWNRLIEQQLLYSTDPAMASRLLAPAPSSAAIHPDAPGETAAWVGAQIVKAYVKRHPDTSMEQLLQPEFYNSASTLVESGYSPK